MAARNLLARTVFVNCLGLLPLSDRSVDLKQYRYHSGRREICDQAKYSELVAFAKVMPRIRRKVRRDLKKRGLTRNKVLAAIVRLLETSLIRVGNEEYARENRSFRLTTMRDRHVELAGNKVSFHFRGKGGDVHKVDLEFTLLTCVVRRCQEFPGQELFQCADEHEEADAGGSTDVNDNLREISYRAISA